MRGGGGHSCSPGCGYYHSGMSTETAADLMERIERAIDTMRPYIASHKGNVEVVDFDADSGHLLVRLGGTCVGCAASTITLKQGLEIRLRDSVPEVRGVDAV